MPAALLLEHGFNRGALAAARSLHRAGWTVGVGASERPGLASASRAVSRVHGVPAPSGESSAFISAVRAAVEDGGYDVVFPVDDAQVVALSQDRDQVPAVVPYPSHPAVLRAMDRLAVARAAEAIGIAVPETRSLDDRILAELNGAEVVVKSRHYASSGIGADRSRFETRLCTPAQARERAAEMRRSSAEPLVQEAIDGRLMSVSMLVDSDGSIAGLEQQLAYATWPPRAGVSTRARTTEVNEPLVEQLRELLLRLGYFGFAQIQFLLPTDGVPRLIDVNPRFYGSLALAVAAGSDLPVLWADMAIGRPITPAIARSGVRYHWFGGDLRRALREQRGGALRDASESLRWAMGATAGVWSVSDPAPALRALRRTAGGRLGRGA